MINRYTKAAFALMTGALVLTAALPVQAGCSYLRDDNGRVITATNGLPVAVMEDVYKAKAQRPYTVKGAVYHPVLDTESFTQAGHASWYGRPFHGRKTANGEIYDMFAYTAAHRTLPIPSCVRVTNLDNGRSIVVRINDRGPFKSDHGAYRQQRVIDLSMRAAVALDFKHDGTAPVRVEALPMNTDIIAPVHWSAALSSSRK